MGDIHGEFEGLLSILRAAELIDEQNQWIGGNATLVQTGDFVDRGPGVHQVLDLLMSLEEQAAKDGGQVVVLLGNHEVMNLVGDFRDGNPDVYAQFQSPDSEKLRKEAWREWTRWLSRLATRRGGSPPAISKEMKTEWMDKHPLGFLEYVQSLRPDGLYGAWLLERPIMVQFGDTIFMHAGISPEYSNKSIEEINQLHREQIQAFVQHREALIEAGVTPWFFDLFDINQALIYQANNPPLPKFASPIEQKLITEASAGLNTMQQILLKDSPLWWRGFTTLSDAELAVHMESLKQNFGAERFVVAHSPLDSGNIRNRLEGKVFLIDTGMLESYYHGRPSALEVADDQVSAVYVDERQILMEREQVDMIPASAAATDSVSVHGHIAVPAVYRSDDLHALRLAAFPPQGGEDAGSLIPQRVFRDPDGNALPFSNPAEIEQFLSTARVVSQTEIPVGVTKPKKLVLEKDGIRAHAKFNYVDRQGQGERLADGTVEMYFLDSYKADMASYRLAQMLGVDMVPPGVVREIDGTTGVVQMWVESLTSYKTWVEEGNSGNPDSLYLERQIKDMRVFDLLIRNTDRNQGNINWDQDKNLWLVDQTRSMARDAGLRTGDMDKFKGCSRELYEALRDLDESAVERELSPFLGSFEIKALLKRRVKLLKLIDGQIKKKGEGEVLFSYTDAPPGLVITYDDAASLQLVPDPVEIQPTA